MICPKCRVKLVRAHDWSYCPICNTSFSKYDLQALREIADSQLKRLIDLEAV